MDEWKDTSVNFPPRRSVPTYDRRCLWGIDRNETMGFDEVDENWRGFFLHKKISEVFGEFGLRWDFRMEFLPRVHVEPKWLFVIAEVYFIFYPSPSFILVHSFTLFFHTYLIFNIPGMITFRHINGSTQTTSLTGPKKRAHFPHIPRIY